MVQDKEGLVSVIGHHTLGSQGQGEGQGEGETGVTDDDSRGTACLQLLLLTLSTVPEVVSVGLSERPRIMNGEARGLVQTGGVSGSNHANHANHANHTDHTRPYRPLPILTDLYRP